MTDYNEVSQLQTRIAILESQLQVKETALGGQRAEIERLTNLVGTLLKKGMVIAIEPMVNIGSWRTKVLEDNWTIVTLDGSMSAHFENTLLVTEGDAEVLTRL